tara:strand:- start:14668 stop:15243 length:576 start_codon:yes stop_codon:yes gene_type:complete
MASQMINPAFVALLQKKLDESTTNRYYLPFNTIAGLNATAYIIRWNRHDDTKAYDFAVELDDVVMCCLRGDSYRLYGSQSRDNIKSVLEDFIEFTDKVVVDKLNGKLVMNNDAEKEGELVKEFCDLFEKKNMIPSIKECCVCYAPTKTRTDCKHSVCISCISGIEMKEDENEDDCHFKQCPMCRENIEEFN